MIKIQKTLDLVNTIELQIALDQLDLDDEFLYTDTLNNELEELNNNLSQFVEDYEARYKTTIVAYAFVGERFSHYGMIGGNGEICGTSSETMKLEHTLNGCDDFAFNITEDKHLELVKMDHDGNNSMKLRLVTKNEFETYQYYSDDYLNLAEFIFKLGKKPTKVSNTFLDNYI